jgi:hypothetical protein
MKTFLKRILPRTWVGVMANLLNKLSRQFVVRFFFKEYPKDKIQFIHEWSTRPVELIPERSESSYKQLPVRIADAFKDFNSHEQKEFVASVDNCFIEPKYGWPISPSNELIYDCFPHSRQPIMPTPSVSSIKNSQHRQFDVIISFREILEFGYWHFYNDIIHKNYLIDEFTSLDKAIPILVSKQLASKPHFQFFYKQTDLFAGRDVIIQDDFLVKASRAYFIKSMPHKPEYFRRTSEKAKLWKGDQSLNRRIFLTRSRDRGRYIDNESEIVRMLQKYSFECVDADRLTIEQQIRIFSEAAFVVGIHGAGLTNMMFRYPYQMNVLEILPDVPERFAIPPHYFLLSGIFGFHYNAVLGSTYVKKLEKSFTVNAAELELSLQAMLERSRG